jgi:exodeoxyribonuclease V alpha subunit
VVLRKVHRFGGGIATLAEAIRRGDAGAVIDVLASGGSGGDLAWIDADTAETGPNRAALAPVRAAVETSAVAVVSAARAGDASAALAALGRFRLLCAHRRGPYGVAAWTVHLESWLAAAVDGYVTNERWYAGRPLLVTENDHSLRLFNGDTGVVVVGADGALRAAFERRGGVVEVSPSRLDAVETMHAMTVHKSQGSQLDEVAVVLPDPSSPILTRELIYTAVTRARSRLTVVGTEASIRAAVERPVARASGLRQLLWGDR